MKIKIIAPDDPAIDVAVETTRRKPGLEAEITIIPWADYHEVLMDSLAAEISPNQAVFVPGHVWIPELVDKGLISPLEPLKIKISKETWLSYRAEDILECVAKESCFGDQQFMIPTFNDGHILFYRSDLLKLNNIEDLPVFSPFELFDLASKVHNPPVIFGLALKAHPSEILFDWLPFLFAAGGEVLDSSLQPVFSSSAGIKALEYYCQLRAFCPEDTHNYGNAEIASILRNGKAALVSTWGGQAAPIFLDAGNRFRDLYKAAIYSKPCGGTWGIVIPSNQPDHHKQRALQVALEINGPSQDMEIIIKAGSPIRKSSYTEESYNRFFWLKAQSEMLKRISWLPRQPKIGLVLGPLSEALYQAFTGEKEAAESLRNAEEKIKVVLAN